MSATQRHTSSRPALRRRIRTTFITGMATLAVAAVGATSATAATVPLASGTTALTLDSATAGALTDLGIAVHRTGAARVIKGGFAFPVSGGRIDPATAVGTINHSGGILLRSSNTTVRLTDFRVKVSGSPVMYARVNGSRAFVPVITPVLSAVKLGRPGVGTIVSGVKLNLNATGAAALRQAFGSSAFKAGLTLGTAKLSLVPKEVVFTGGATQLTVPAATVGVLTSLGVTPGVTAGASLTTSGAFNFPITKGRVNAKSLAGTIDHSGGLTLTAGSTVVTLANFRIDTVKSQLWGQVNGSAPVALFDLGLGKVKVSVASRKVTVGNATAKLTGGAATALNSAFGVTAFAAGIDFGTAIVAGKTA